MVYEPDKHAMNYVPVPLALGDGPYNHVFFSDYNQAVEATGAMVLAGAGLGALIGYFVGGKRHRMAGALGGAALGGVPAFMGARLLTGV